MTERRGGGKRQGRVKEWKAIGPKSVMRGARALRPPPTIRTPVRTFERTKGSPRREATYVHLLPGAYVARQARSAGHAYVSRITTWPRPVLPSAPDAVAYRIPHKIRYLTRASAWSMRHRFQDGHNPEEAVQMASNHCALCVERSILTRTIRSQADVDTEDGQFSRAKHRRVIGLPTCVLKQEQH